MPREGEEEEGAEESEEGDWEDEDNEDVHDRSGGDGDGGDDNGNGGFSNRLRKATAKRRFPRYRSGRPRPPLRKKASTAVAAATVLMRHPASNTTVKWRTAGVKDTNGNELHEGASYRLVATVKEVVPGEAPGTVEVTRCRLTHVTPDAGGR